MNAITNGYQPAVKGVTFPGAEDALDAASLRVRARLELLRQEAIAEGLLPPTDDSEPGAMTAAASEAIDALLDRVAPPIVPDEAACRRHFEAHRARFAHGERVRARHILFAVTPGVDVAKLRQRAEACLLDLRARARDEAVDRFGQAARELSNCPSGRDGGQLDWLEASDCAPEFARELFGRSEVGVLPRLVHSRYGLHVVEIQERQAGRVPAFEEVAPAVAADLCRQHFGEAVRGYVLELARRSKIEE